MRHHLVTVVGAVVGIVLVALLVIGVALEVWTLTALAAGALGLAILVVQLDTWRRTRSLRSFVKAEVRRSTDRVATSLPSGLVAPQGSSVTDDDVMGAVRLMQAQYTGRLDRMQRALDEALDRLAAAGPPSDPSAR